MPRELSEKHKKAMQEGRARARRERQEGAFERVGAFRAWLKEDADYWHRLCIGEITREEYLASKPRCPGIPESADFAIVDGEEAA